MNDAHKDLALTCGTKTGGTNQHGQPARCTEMLTYEDDYTGMARKEGLANKALRLECDECGGVSLVCPVCHGEGWYRGESTGEMLACHNCNQQEAARQMRSPY